MLAVPEACWTVVVDGELQPGALPNNASLDAFEKFYNFSDDRLWNQVNDVSDITKSPHLTHLGQSESLLCVHRIPINHSAVASDRSCAKV
jgi:hypothetical protein